MADWTYTFLDARTDVELATLPMVGTSFEKLINGTGRFEGTIPTGSDAVRAMNPWAATTPRRTCVAASLGDQMMWYGMVWIRERSPGGGGLKITAATLDSWLATQLLLLDASLPNKTAAQIMTALLAQVQGVLGGNLNIALNDVTPAGSAVTRSRSYSRAALADVLAIMGTFLQTATPVEWRFDAAWLPGGGVQKTLVFGEPRIGRTTDVSNLHAWWDVTRAGSTLTDFTDTEDGSVQANAVAGAITAPSDTQTEGTNFATLGMHGLGTLSTSRTPAPQTPDALWSYHTTDEIGVTEVASGFPLMMKPLSTSGAAISTADQLDDAVLGAVADSVSQGRAWTNFAVRLDDPDVTTYDVGDDLDVEITDPAYQEFPNAYTTKVRIGGRKITPRGPNTPDKVELTVWPATSPRLPRSTTLVAHMRDLIRRVKALEQN